MIFIFEPAYAIIQYPHPDKAAEFTRSPRSDARPTLFEALERELNLKLVKRQQVIPIIVVDHVNDKPKD